MVGIGTSSRRALPVKRVERLGGLPRGREVVARPPGVVGRRGLLAEPGERRDEGFAGGDGVAAARESLIAALARFSEQAAATDDPRRARDHLAAAREAAEAIDALDR